MLDTVSEISQFNAKRDPARLALKYQRMRSNAFVFLRGTCHLFYKRLPQQKLFTKAPLVWSCGDLHLENFGSYKADNRLVYFDINDFDEAVLAPLTWDLVRFLASLHTAADTLHVSREQAHALGDGFLTAYYAALAQGKARWIERETATGLVGGLLGQLASRTRSAFLDSRTVRKGKSRQLRIDGKHALAATPAEREHVTELINTLAHTQEHPHFYEVLDVARRIAGTGSLGAERYVVLVAGKGSPDNHYLLDLKRALPSSLMPRLEVPQPTWPSQADRVVNLQRRMQAVSMAFLHAIQSGKKSHVLRALQPVEDRLSLDGTGAGIEGLRGAVVQMGQCVAWAQLRSSGRQGSAITDELIHIGHAQRWRKSLLSLAEDAAHQVQQDWAHYALAYDDGAFKV